MNGRSGTETWRVRCLRASVPPCHGISVVDSPDVLGRIPLGGRFAVGVRRAKLSRMELPESLQVTYDDATFAYTQGDYAGAAAIFRRMLVDHPDLFDVRLSLAMCLYREGDFAAAIVEGHRAEKLKPNEQLVHTNLSLFYMKSGDKQTAEKHGLQARIASWKEGMAKPPTEAPALAPGIDPELQLAQPKLKAFKLPEKFPDMPWKKKADAQKAAASAQAHSHAHSHDHSHTTEKPATDDHPRA